ncbi:MAG: hypothetical protein HYZ14_03050 [Bacteroidetes bacterium]|nr:hypothetical protein [Bacteroidota bacterium]
MEKKKGNTKQLEKKSNTGKYILIGFGIVALAGGIYYMANRNKSTSSMVSDDLLFPTAEEDEPKSSASSGGSSSGFPLKKGSRGELVKNIQQMLIQKYGAAILPKYGADGVWGSEMDTALIAKGLPTNIDADAFTQLITTTNIPATTTTTDKPKFDPVLLATNLRLAILDNNLDKALTSLSKIFTVKGYTTVNEEFKKTRINGVRKTIVNALLTKFYQDAQKKKLNEQFYRMGLKYDGSQWSLSGVGQILCDQIKSIAPTRVWNAKGTAINVPRHTVLGEFLDGRNGITRFQTLDGQILYTNTKCICYV